MILLTVGLVAAEMVDECIPLQGALCRGNREPQILVVEQGEQFTLPLDRLIKRILLAVLA
jgi:hypothetical protein